MKIKCPKCKQTSEINIGKLVGKVGKGVKRKFSPEQIKLRTERLKANRFQRPKKGE